MIKLKDACMVSVVVVAKNEEKNIASCLDSLVKQSFKEKYEIIVVDGGSTDATQQIIKKYPVKLIIDTFGTIGHQRNTGVQNAKGQYIAFTDADCVADIFWLEMLVSSINNSPCEVVAIGGPNLVMSWDFAFAKIVGYSQETFIGSGGSVQSMNSKKELKNVQSIPNCNAIYKKEILVKEKYNNYISIGEDADLNFRLKKRGYRFIYQPNAIVWHRRTSNYFLFVKKMFNYGKAIGRLTKFYRTVVRWYAILPILSIFWGGTFVLWRYQTGNTFLDLWFFLLFIIYLLGLIYSTMQVWQKTKNIVAFWTPILLLTQHLTYGIGFLSGLIERSETN